MTTELPIPPDDEPTWFVGFDWGSEKHRVSLFDRSGKLIERRDVAHSATAYAEFGDWLLRTTGAAPQQIAVAIETSHGPVVDALIDRGFRAFAINPKQLDRFRDRYSVAGAKDDTRDADTLGGSLRTDRMAFRELSPDNPLIVQLREATRTAGELTKDLGRLTNQMRELLWRYYPQMRALADDPADAWILELWQQAPTPVKGAKLHKQTIARILKAHRIRRLDADQVRAILKQPPLPSAPGVTEAAVSHIRLLVPRIRLLNRQIKEVHAEIDALAAQLAGPQTIEPGESVPGQTIEQRDVTIPRVKPKGRLCTPCQGLEGSSAPRCSPRPASLCAGETTTPSVPWQARACPCEGGGAGHQTQRQELFRATPAGLQQTAGQRDVSLGPRRHHARSQEQAALRRATGPRMQPWPGPAQRGRSAAEAALHAAATPGAVRSQPQRKGGGSRVGRTSAPYDTDQTIMTVSLFGLGAVSSSRPADTRASRAAAVKDGRRPPPQAARSVLDGGEHDATLTAGWAKKTSVRHLSRLTEKVRGPCNVSRMPGRPAPPQPQPTAGPPLHARVVEHPSWPAPRR